MYIFFEYAACLILTAFVMMLLFAGCALFNPLSQGAADIIGRLTSGIAHEARDLVRGLTEGSPCRRARTYSRRLRSSVLPKGVAMFQMVNEEPREPQERKKIVLVKVGVFSVALLVLCAIVCFFVFLPYTNR
jgi:hypothetical protein